MTGAPRFSVIIPVYNRRQPLERALRSVLAQTLTDFELLVVDDGSAEPWASTIAELVATLADPRLSLLVNPQHMNGAVARNRALAVARGHYCCFLDSDDEWLPTKLAVVAEALQRDVVELLYHPYHNVVAGQRQRAQPERGLKAGERLDDYLFGRCAGKGMQTSCLVVATGLARRVAFDERLAGHQDWDFVLRLAAEPELRVAFVAEPLTLRHLEGDNLGGRLDYRYSLAFWQQRRAALSWRANAGFVAAALMPRLLAEYPPAAGGGWQLAAWLCHPRQCWAHWRRYRALLSRCQRLVAYCRRHQVSQLLLVGANGYSRFFAGFCPAWLRLLAVVDQQAGAGVATLPVMSAADLPGEQWRQAQLIVTMTDRHHASMCATLAPYAGTTRIIPF